MHCKFLCKDNNSDIRPSILREISFIGLIPSHPLIFCFVQSDFPYFLRLYSVSPLNSNLRLSFLQKYFQSNFFRRYTKQCGRCQCAIDSQTLVMHVRESVFHLQCFSCIVCGEMLRQGEKFALGPNGNLTCYLHMDPFLVQQGPEPENPGPIKSRANNRNTIISKSESREFCFHFRFPPQGIFLRKLR